MAAGPRTPTPIPLSDDEPHSLIGHQQQAMRELFRQSGISLASYSMEVVAVARAAAADGDYSAAANLYKIVGQHIGALAGESHKHVHLHGAPAADANQNGDFRATSDDALRSLIAQARMQNTIQEAEVISQQNIQINENA